MILKVCSSRNECALCEKHAKTETEWSGKEESELGSHKSTPPFLPVLLRTQELI